MTDFGSVVETEKWPERPNEGFRNPSTHFRGPTLVAKGRCDSAVMVPDVADAGGGCSLVWQASRQPLTFSVRDGTQRSVRASEQVLHQ